VNAIVYFDPLSGLRTVPSPPSNFTSCHEVPASGDAALALWPAMSDVERVTMAATPSQTDLRSMYMVGLS